MNFSPNSPVVLTRPAFPNKSTALYVVPRENGRLDLIRNGALFGLDKDEQAALLGFLLLLEKEIQPCLPNT